MAACHDPRYKDMSGLTPRREIAWWVFKQNLKLPWLRDPVSLAIHRDSIIGFAWVEKETRKTGRLSVHVLPGYRMQGIGRRMIGEVIGMSTGRLNTIDLEVFRSNEAARRLYTWFGFVCTGEYRLEPLKGINEPVDRMLLYL